ncbi:hypothetical protein K1719_014204 [Acacia pycnantha]|nr:hypothetical protein K1719_014204 [Acacia pycnantha]
MSESERLRQGDGDGRGREDGDGRERDDGGGFHRQSGSEPLTEGMAFTAGSGGEQEKMPVQSSVAKSVDRRPVSVSFKEKLLSPGGLGFLVSHEQEDDIVSGWRGFFVKKNDEMESADRVNESRKEEDECITSSSQYPVLTMTEAQYAAWWKPWMNSLIIKVLGLSIPKHVLFDQVWRIWKPQQPLKVVPLSNGYYIVSFSNKEDRDYAFSEEPWMIDDHYLLAYGVLYSGISGVNKEHDRKNCEIDRSTSIYEKGGFARICVEMDLQTPLLSTFKVFGEEKQLVYEGLHLVCGMYGHEQVVCPDREAGEALESESVKGKRRSVEAGKRKMTGKSDQAHRTELRTVADNINGGATPSSQPVDGVRPAASSRHEFLGPQMLLRRDFRRSSNGLEGIGGGNGGQGVKSGKTQDIQGLMKRESRDCTEGSRGGFQNGNKHFMGSDLKKSNSTNGPNEKPKSK